MNKAQPIIVLTTETGRRVGVICCESCGAMLLLDDLHPQGRREYIERHNRWHSNQHAAIERAANTYVEPPVFG